jgi:hypothetical protein
MLQNPASDQQPVGETPGLACQPSKDPIQVGGCRVEIIWDFRLVFIPVEEEHQTIHRFFLSGVTQLRELLGV